MAQTVANQIADGDVNHVLVQTDIDNTTYFFSDGQLQISDISGISVFTNLASINIYQNWSLTTIPDEILNLTNLQYLSVRYNDISHIPDDIGNLTSLTHLDISANPLTSFPSSIWNLTNLKHLDISSTNSAALTELPDVFDQFTNLFFLNLEGHNLSDLPPTFWDLSNLNTLSINRNHFTQLSDDISRLLNLEHLTMRENQLTSLPEGLWNLANLIDLEFANNQITDLSPNIGNLVNLNNLRAQYNQIDVLPDNIGNLSNLIILDLGTNQITVLPDTIGNLGNLREFYFWNNQISVLPDSIGNLDNLIDFYVNGNKLTEINPALGNAANLTILDLSNNQLAHVPPEIGYLTNLQRLSLSDNNISVLPDTLSNLYHLNYLYLSNNQLKIIPNSIGQSTNLITLDASSNQLETLPETLGNLTNLKELNVYDNNLVTLPSTIDYSNIDFLVLGNNQLTNLPDTILNLRPELLWGYYLDYNLFPVGYADILNTLFNTTTIWDQYQDELLVDQPTAFNINNQTDIDTINYASFLSLESGRSLSTLHTYKLVNYTDESNNPVNIDDYIQNGVVIKEGAVYANITVVTTDGVFPADSIFPTTTEKVKLNFIFQEPTFSLNFDLRGGDGPVPNEQQVEEGGLATPVDDPSRTGYTFIGWNTSEDGSGETWDFTTTTMPANSVILNAQWVATAAEFTLKFNLNGNSDVPPSDQLLKEGEKASEPANPVRAGYLFKSWNTSEDGTGTTWNFATTTMPANDITLYTHWEKKTDPITEYTLRFNLNGSSGTPPSNQVLKKGQGQKALQPAPPIREGYTFKSWNTTADGTGTTWNFILNTMPPNDITLYAQWTDNKNLPQTGSWTALIAITSLLFGTSILGIAIRKKQ